MEINQLANGNYEFNGVECFRLKIDESFQTKKYIFRNPSSGTGNSIYSLEFVEYYIGTPDNTYEYIYVPLKYKQTIPRKYRGVNEYARIWRNAYYIQHIQPGIVLSDYTKFRKMYPNKKDIDFVYDYVPTSTVNIQIEGDHSNELIRAILGERIKEDVNRKTPEFVSDPFYIQKRVLFILFVLLIIISFIMVYITGPLK